MNLKDKARELCYEIEQLPASTQQTACSILASNLSQAIQGRLNDEDIAALLYEAYCVNVGGKAFNGEPLPSWDKFRSDPAKTVQSNAWIRVATMAQILANP